ncbi:MAG: hypothetical protein Fur0044_02210 [Anaerolineae bacterium]|nr:winged helix-turn-helix domain-containing protein [Anaerolineales bacterium]
MKLAEDLSLTGSAQAPEKWVVAAELCHTLQYQQMAELLGQVQLTSEQLGNTSLAQMLAMTRSMCLVYSQPQANRVELPWLNAGASPFIFPPEPVAVGPNSAELVIYCLGPFRVYQNGQLVTNWPSLKAQSILKYLSAQRGGPVVRDILMDTLWPEADADAARRNLHQAVYSLRQTLKQSQPCLQPIQFEQDSYLLNPALKVWIDWVEFEKYAQAGQRLEAQGRLAEAMAAFRHAEALYRGDFLEDDLYEDWASLTREHARATYLNLADRLSEHCLRYGEIEAAISLSQRILARDNCHEQAHCRLMRCYSLQGLRSLAVRQYQLCVQTLKAELDMLPSPATQALYQKIIGQEVLNLDTN